MGETISRCRGGRAGVLGLLGVLFSICLFFSPAHAAMDGSLGSLTQDVARLSMELGRTIPCPLPPGTMAGIGQGRPVPLSSLCVVVEMSSFLHRDKIREYMRLMPPEKVFAVYWEGALPARVFLGPAYRSYRTLILSKKKAPREVSSGRFLFLVRPGGILAVDRTLLPPGLDPATLSP